MTTLYEHAFQTVSKLVDAFAANELFHVSSQFQEAEVRKYFIDKFFKALGWDVDHDQQQNPHEREVRIEKNSDALSTRRADYAFYLKPNFDRPVFLVEAKKPSVDLSNPDSYFQTVRYGFNTSTSIAVLTNFEEFHVLDCRREPERTEGIVLYAQLKKFSYKDYQNREKFEWIYWRFSREAVEAGNLKRYWKEELPKPKGKSKQLKLIGDELAPIDENFLAKLDEYRHTLASEIYKTNKNLEARELTEAAQKILDRLVFMRFLEDNLLETHSLVDSFGDRGRAWNRFIMASQRLNIIYNGIVFRESLIDRPALNPPNDDKFFQICQSFGHQDSPYLFSYIAVEMVGSIYERFLSKIVVKKGSGIDIVPKPEVRIAGGVYYTPKYIVDYIVKHTVGNVLKGKTPEQVAELRFLDIACGSGSFLIGVFGAIVHHLEEWYNTHPDEAKKTRRAESKNAKGQPRCRLTEEGKFVLTLNEKRRVLRANIYGVDIDPQATEVAQLSLFLKLLEHETTATREAAQSELQLGGSLGKAVLPDMSKNILCGNSLVEYNITELFSLTTEEERKFRPFRFQQKFQPVMDAGGFDVIVGNPPYVRPHHMDVHLKEYLWKHYTTFVRKSDLYCGFIEKSIQLLKDGGRFGYIVSDGLLRLDSFEKLRALLLSETQVERIIDYQCNIFDEANVRTCILTFRKKERASGDVLVAESGEPVDPNTLQLKQIKQGIFREGYKSIFDLSIDPAQESIKSKMKSRGKPLGSMYDLAFGFKTGDDSKFLSYEQKNSKYKPVLRGEDVHRYSYAFKGEYVWYAPEKMTAHRRTARPGNAERFEQPKVLVRDTGNLLESTLDECNYYVKDVLVVADKEGSVDRLSYLTAIINSRLMSFFYMTSFPTIHVQRGELASLPIIPFPESTLCQTIASKARQILLANEELATTRNDLDREQIAGRCSYLDDEINQLVYDLYGLDRKEVGVVKAAFLNLKRPKTT